MLTENHGGPSVIQRTLRQSVPSFASFPAAVHAVTGIQGLTSSVMLRAKRSIRLRGDGRHGVKAYFRQFLSDLG